MAFRHVLKLLQFVSAAKGLLIPRNNALPWSYDGAKLNKCAEFRRHFGLVDTFNVLIKEMLLLDVVVLFDELLFGRLPLIEHV